VANDRKHGVNHTLWHTNRSPYVHEIRRRMGQQTRPQHTTQLGSVGEAINPEAWKWYYRVIGKEKLPIIDTWWQTETGGFMISPAIRHRTYTTKTRLSHACHCQELTLTSSTKRTISTTRNQRLLVIKSPWPGMLQTIWKDPDRFKQTYFGKWPGIYYVGDYAIRDPDGYFWLLGRADEVLKVAGHRIGTVELESALVSHPAVSEAAVMGKEDAVKGEVPVAFVVLRSGFTPSDQLSAELIKHVRTTIGPIATPDAVVIVAKLPKTRSGKIMRRLLKAVLTGAPLGDTSPSKTKAQSKTSKQHTTSYASNSRQNKQTIFFFLFIFNPF
jgi:acetyl-CoA synthetase